MKKKKNRAGKSARFLGDLCEFIRIFSPLGKDVGTIVSSQIYARNISVVIILISDSSVQSGE